MQKLTKVVFLVTAACLSTAALAQKSTQELLREIEASNRAAQLEIEQSRLRWQQMEADMATRRAEHERLRAETNRLRMWNESQDTADRAREIAERAEQAAFAQVEAAKKAEEAAEELRNEMDRAEIRTKNNLYLGALLLFTIWPIAYIIRKSKREQNIMQENQKFGVATMIGSALVILLGVMISSDWSNYYDFLQNLMSSLRIQLFEKEFPHNTYYIDVPTKFVVMACICAAAYGLTTYLGITPMPKWKAGKDGQDSKLT